MTGKEHILVAGCGCLGSALGIRLASHGHTVWGLRRQPSNLPRSMRGVEADLRVPKTLRRIPDVDVVYYVAGPERDSDDARQAAHVDGIRYLLQVLHAGRYPPRRLFYASCLNVYGADDGRWVDEDSPLEQDSPSGRALRQGEATVAEASFQTTIVRFGELYGDGRPGLLRPVLDGRHVPGWHAKRWLNLIHRDDAVGVLVHLLGLHKPADLYVSVDREPVDASTVAIWMADQLGRDPPVFDGHTASRRGSLPTNVRALSERLVDSGYRFVYPTFREGYRTLLPRVP